MTRVFTQTFGVAAGLIERDGKILLVREAQRKGPDHGKWNHPAGWIDVGENPIDAVRREVLEESGFAFTPTHLLGVYSLVRRDIEKDLDGTPHALKIVFTGEVSETRSSTLADDVTEAAWFSPEEIDAMDSATLRDADIKQMVRDYFSGKRMPLDYIHHTVVGV